MESPGAAAADMATAVRDFWEQDACGEVYADGERPADRLAAQRRARYKLEPYIPGFARFSDGAGADVLEIGVGMGADHALWAAGGPRSLTGIDITERALEWTRSGLADQAANPALARSDALRLPF